MKRKYNINQIDERMLKYANAYIKQVVNNAQKNYFRNCLKHTRYNISFEEYNDNINYNADEHYEINVPLRFFDFGTIRIYIESKTLYEELIKLTDKQLEVILKNIVLDIPMQDISMQMGISLGKAYKHKRNALKILQRRLSNNEFNV